MKFPTAIALSLAIAFTLASPVRHEDSLHARDMYKHNGSGSLATPDKRGGDPTSSPFKSFSDATGSIGGHLAGNSAPDDLPRTMSSSKSQSHSTPQRPPQSPTYHTGQHPRRSRRRSLQHASQPFSLEKRISRRAFSMPIARGFSPLKMIKAVFNRTPQASSQANSRNPPKKKKSKGHDILIALVEALNHGVGS